MFLKHLLPFAATALAAPAPSSLEARATGSLTSWLASESPIALQGVLNNIGASGAKVPGASNGIVVASPSTNDPDYFFTWTRDAALVFKALVDQFLGGTASSANLEPKIQDYISAQAALQGVNNP